MDQPRHQRIAKLAGQEEEKKKGAPRQPNRCLAPLHRTPCVASVHRAHA